MFLEWKQKHLLVLVLLLLTTQCPSLSLANETKCKALYSSMDSVFFGNLLRQSQNKEELEFLNSLSILNLQFSDKPQPEEHMINSLLFYRRAIELNIEIEVLSKDMYRYILNNSLPLISKKPKFLFFENYLKGQKTESTAETLD